MPMTILARKRFGQNFLHDRHVIHKIIQAISPATRTHLVEIGPGRGALTFPLLEEATQFTAIEIDRDLIAWLTEKAPKPFNLIEGDALKINFRELGHPLTVIGNLPYNISTPILFHLLSFRDVIDEMYFMLQKEVVERMAAEPDSKDYGRLSVMVQYFCEVEPLFVVSSGAFTPAPKVESMVVRLKPYKTSPYGEIKDFKRFEHIVQLGFNQRRKTLHNALKSANLILPDTLAQKRAGELSIQDWVMLAE
jgi:16S rRNA (adenine1518-N6/adenine1519-N6)-dimethyltransferase